MAKKMEFKTAKRDQVYIKAVITGPSGSGKSYSALRVATGIAEKVGVKGAGGSMIAYIGSEKGGKQTPKKVGMGAQQDKDLQYEYTVAFMLDQDSHLAHAEKDNTHLFELNEVLTEKSGEKLYEWSVKGDAPAKQRQTTDEVEAEKLKEAQEAIIAKCKELGGQKNKELMKILKQYEPKGNPNKITGLADANECLRALAGVEPVKEAKS